MGPCQSGESYNDKGVGIPLINGPTEFGDNPFSETLKTKFTTEPSSKFSEKGDLIICVRGSTTGRINISGFKACIGRGVAAIRTIEVKQWFVNIFMRQQYDKILSSGTGSTFPSINADFLNDFLVPLPTIKEQEKIIELVLNHLKWAEDFEKLVSNSKKELYYLRQTLLTKAFAGQLLSEDELSAVQLEPDYEPASVLLERIKEEKLRLVDEMKEKRTKTKSKTRSFKTKIMSELTIIQVLQTQNGKSMKARDVWKASKYREEKGIDDFYAELRQVVEVEKSVFSSVAEDQETYLSLNTTSKHED